MRKHSPFSLQKSEFVFVKFDEPFASHFGKLARHGASVYRKKICQLLPVERDPDAAAVLLFCLFGKIGNEFFPCRTFGNMPKFLHEPAVFL